MAMRREGPLRRLATYNQKLLKIKHLAGRKPE
jgi:hypothetical protein